MESLTITLAQYMGPVLIATGLGIFFSRNYYTKVYRDLEKETLAVFMSGITILTAGIAIVVHHNKWDSLLAGIITLIGWLSILKGLVLIIKPQVADNLGEKVANSKLFGLIAVLATVLGVYVTYMAYFY